MATVTRVESHLRAVLHVDELYKGRVPVTIGVSGGGSGQCGIMLADGKQYLLFLSEGDGYGTFSMNSCNPDALAAAGDRTVRWVRKHKKLKVSE